MNDLVSPEVLEQVKGWVPYVEAKLGFRNHWYPLCLADEIVEQEPIARKLLGENILLNRIDGTVFCIKDRCLHRGVKFSADLQCHTKNTVTCWYHGWTYRWDTGKLVDILTNPQSVQIGRHNIRAYPVQEAKGIIFVFMGDREPTPLEQDVPPGFLDNDRVIFGRHQTVNANWRIGAENGFDGGHVYIHRNSVLVEGNDIALPLGFAPGKGKENFRAEVGEEGPTGVWDLLGEHSVPVFAASIEGQEAIMRGHMGSKRVAHTISIWLPGVLRVDPWPDTNTTQYEWYVPVSETEHIYFQTLGKICSSDEEAKEWEAAFHKKWVPMALEGFNNDDLKARLETQPFYEDDRGWLNEILYEPDRCIIEWRRIASKHNRGIQSKEHL